MGNSLLSPSRATRVFTVAIAAAVSLYALVLAFAEPMRSFAASSAQNVVVSLTVAQDISNTCTTPVSLGTITRTGDSSQNLCGATGLCRFAKTKCVVSTNNALGYALYWQITTGTGATGSRTGTGYLNGFTASNRIAPLGTGSTVASMQPQAMTAGGTVNNDARWAGRLSSSGTTTTGGGTVSWGSDGTTDTWLRVSTGSQVKIASRATATTVAGDEEYIGFRAIIHGTAIVPSDTYKATVVFTATTN